MIFVAVIASEAKQSRAFAEIASVASLPRNDAVVNCILLKISNLKSSVISAQNILRKIVFFAINATAKYYVLVSSAVARCSMSLISLYICAEIRKNKRSPQACI